MQRILLYSSRGSALNPASMYEKREQLRKLYHGLPSALSREPIPPSVPPSSISMLSRFRGDYLKCRHCKFVLARKDAKISGFDSQSSLRYIRCPRCAKIITHAPEAGPITDVVKGVGIAATGVATIVLGFPVASVFALQAGSFLSLYGSLTALIRPGEQKRKKKM